MEQEHRAVAMQRRPRAILILPALNEERALPLVLGDVPPGLFSEIIVVDNGSTDGTFEAARQAGATVVSEPRRGYGQACLAGLERALGDGSLAPRDAIAFCDADRSDFAEDLESVVRPVLDGSVDMVIGSRIAGGGASVLPSQARFGTRLACRLMALLFGARWSDLGPMRAIRVDALEHLAMADTDYGWTIEMQLKAHAAKLRTLEVPVRYRQRIGTSKISGTLRGTLGASVKILGWIGAWRVALWRRRPEPFTRSSISRASI